ncbi:unnamed protein product, partial [Bubo scandiacus]
KNERPGPASPSGGRGLSEDVQLTVCASVCHRCQATRWPLYTSLVAAGAMTDT